MLRDCWCDFFELFEAIVYTWMAKTCNNSWNIECHQLHYDSTLPLERQRCHLERVGGKLINGLMCQNMRDLYSFCHLLLPPMNEFSSQYYDDGKVLLFTWSELNWGNYDNMFIRARAHFSPFFFLLSNFRIKSIMINSLLDLQLTLCQWHSSGK